MARYLVTGANGFLGRHLVQALLGDVDAVTALVRRKASASGLGDLDGVDIALGDVLDPASLESAVAGSGNESAEDGAIDGVFHCAGKVSRKAEDAEELYRVHVEGTKNVVAACIAQGVPRVVVASTSGTIAVSEEPDRIATEEDEPPIGLLNRWPYYRAKLFAEQAALSANGAPLANGKGTLAVVCVNPTLLLGPGDVNGSSTEDVRLFLERKIPAVPPGGLSYVDVRDAARGMVLAMEKGIGGRCYLLGACNLTLKELFGRLERISGVRAPIFPMPRAGREVARTGAEMLDKLAQRFGFAIAVDPISIDMAHFYWYLDASRAEAELGWTPRDPIETLADTVRDLQERGVVWPEAGTSLLSTLRRRATGLEPRTSRE